MSKCAMCQRPAKMALRLTLPWRHAPKAPPMVADEHFCGQRCGVEWAKSESEEWDERAGRTRWRSFPKGTELVEITPYEVGEFVLECGTVRGPGDDRPVPKYRPKDDSYAY